MKIGPMISPPPLVPFISGIRGAFTAAGVTKGGFLLLPFGVNSDGVIEYGLGGVSYYTDMARGGTDWVKNHYMFLGAPEYGSPLADEVALVDDMMRISARDVRSIIRRPWFLRLDDRKALKAERDRLKKLGRLSAEDLGKVPSNRRLEGIAGSLELFFRAASDVSAAAEEVYDMRRSDNFRSAAFHFLSGVLYSMSDHEDSVEYAKVAFMSSARIFAEEGRHAAAALVSEASIRFLAQRVSRAARSLDERNQTSAGGEGASILEAILSEMSMRDVDLDPALLHPKALSTAARNWLDFAKANRAYDGPATMIALQRGILAATVSANPRLHDVRRGLHMLSADLNRERGRDEESGRDFLRLAFSGINCFDGSARAWEGIADALYMGGVSFDKAGKADIARALAPLEGFARKHARGLRSELPPLDRAVASDPFDHAALKRRAFAKLGHGDLGGALDDIRLAREISPDDAWLIADESLLMHHLSHYQAFVGDEASAQESMLEAAVLLRRARERARGSDASKAVLHARAGAIMASTGRLEDALDMLEEAYSMSDADEIGDEIYNYLRALKENIKLIKSSVH